MRAQWLLPAALWLGTLVALPLAVHLLARPWRPPLRFPTLRFLTTASAPARRRWQVRDPGLLAVRMAVVLVTAAAMAGPIWVTAARQAGWNARVARALVAPAALASRVATTEIPDREGIVRAFVNDDVSQALADASAWVAAQGPSQREIVVIGPLSRAALSAAALEAVPADIGLRFERTSALPSNTRARDRLQLRAGTLWRINELVVAGEADTTVREMSRTPERRAIVDVQAAPDARVVADAAVRAVLRRGVVLTTPEATALSAPWTGQAAALAAWLDAQAIDGDAAARAEPVPFTDDELRALTRPPAPRGPSAAVDAGDRRVLWLVVLALLGFETWLRRRPA